MWEPCWRSRPYQVCCDLLDIFQHFTYITVFIMLRNKVNRCRARYSPRATTTNRPTNKELNKPAWPGPNWPKMPILGQIWSFWALGQKILISTGKIKSFVTHITENPPRHLVHIVFWSGIGQNVPKMAIFGPKWPKMHILTKFGDFLAKIPNFYGSKKEFWCPHNGQTT